MFEIRLSFFEFKVRLTQVSQFILKNSYDGDGSGSFGIAFDGANIWVANAGINNVTKLRANDGANLGTFTVGSWPWGIAFDGANIWVTNNGSASVSKL